MLFHRACHSVRAWRKRLFVPLCPLLQLGQKNITSWRLHRGETLNMMRHSNIYFYGMINFYLFLFRIFFILKQFFMNYPWKDPIGKLSTVLGFLYLWYKRSLRWNFCVKYFLTACDVRSENSESRISSA